MKFTILFAILPLLASAAPAAPQASQLGPSITHPQANEQVLDAWAQHRAENIKNGINPNNIDAPPAAYAGEPIGHFYKRAIKETYYVDLFDKNYMWVNIQDTVTGTSTWEHRLMLTSGGPTYSSAAPSSAVSTAKSSSSASKSSSSASKSSASVSSTSKAAVVSVSASLNVSIGLGSASSKPAAASSSSKPAAASSSSKAAASSASSSKAVVSSSTSKAVVSSSTSKAVVSSSTSKAVVSSSTSKAVVSSSTSKAVVSSSTSKAVVSSSTSKAVVSSSTSKAVVSSSKAAASSSSSKAAVSSSSSKVAAISISASVKVSVAPASATSKVAAIVSSSASKAATSSVSSVAASATGGVSAADQAQFVTLHNNFRAKYTAGQVTWDDSLAAFALKTAQTCKYGHTGGPNGENIAAGVGGGYNIEKAFNSWANEDALYNFSKPGYSSATGHFTQIVWKGTTKIGCAAASCSDGTIFTGYGANSTYVVCEYQTPGNIVSSDPTRTAQYFTSNVGPKA